MIDHDRLHKELLTTFFFEFLELFLPQVAAYVDRESIEFLDKEVVSDVTSGEKNEVDILVKAKFRGEDATFLLHCESQSKSQASFPRRMFRYFARMDEEHDLPIYPIALFTYDSPKRPEPTEYTRTFPDFTPLVFRYRTIQLNRLDWHNYINTLNPVASALMAKMMIAPEDRAKVKAECLLSLVRLDLNPAKQQLISGYVDTYLRLNPEEQQVFDKEIAAIAPREQEQAMEIITSWMEKGILQGLAKGRQEGRQEGWQKGQVQVVLRLLRRRCGSVPLPLESKVQALSAAELEGLAEAVLDFSSLASLEGWLEGR